MSLRKIKILADCTCDLSKKQLEKYNITTIPLNVCLGDKTYYDGIDVFPKDLYTYFRKTGKLPVTAAISPEVFMKNYKEWTDLGYDILHITLGSGFSASYNNACIAAKQFPNVIVFDSQNLSTGHGLLVLEAVDMVMEGLELTEIVTRLSETVHKVRASFILDTLLFLWKGGRCSGVAALGANLLNLKPCIEVRNGKMEVGKKYKGKVSLVWGKYAEAKLNGSHGIRSKRAFITHSGEIDSSEIADLICKIESLHQFEEIIVTEAGCTISTHCGPRTLGILFIEE